MERNVGVQFMCWCDVMALWNELMFCRKRVKHWDLLCRIIYTDILLFLFLVCLTTMQIADLKWSWEYLLPESFPFRSPLSVVFYHCLIILLSIHRRHTSMSVRSVVQKDTRKDVSSFDRHCNDDCNILIMYINIVVTGMLWPSVWNFSNVTAVKFIILLYHHPQSWRHDIK
jgi:hypothetical protein